MKGNLTELVARLEKSLNDRLVNVTLYGSHAAGESDSFSDYNVLCVLKQITPRETDEYGEVRWDAVLKNQNDELVASYDVLTLVAKELAPAATA